MTLIEIEQRIHEATTQRHIVGAALAIIKGQEITYANGFGVTSVDEGRPITPQTIFQIGSITKMLTATLCMRLVEAGKLELDRPVVEYLPGYHFSDNQRGQKVTLRHLLSHTSGLVSSGKDWGPCDPDALKRYVWDELSRHGFIADSGEIYLYSNTAIVLAGYLSEVVTGKYYSEILKEYVFDPLHMIRATQELRVAATYPLALPHRQDAKGEIQVHHLFKQNASGTPAGFTLATAIDLANIAIMHVNQGMFMGQPFLAPDSIKAMQGAYGDLHLKGFVHPRAEIFQGYGLGLETGTYRGHRVARHGGMLFNYFELLPDQNTGFVFLSNFNDDSKPAISEIITALYDHLLGLPEDKTFFLAAPPISTSANYQDLWPTFVGDFLSIDRGSLVNISIANNRLVVKQGDQSLELIALTDDDYYAQLAENVRQPVSFHRNADGAMNIVFIWGEPHNRIELDSTFIPDPEKWQAYVGTYEDFRDPEGLQLMHIRVREGQLYAESWGEDGVGIPLSNTTFASPHGLIEFDSTESGYVLIQGKAAHHRRLEQ